ncbi:MAG: hypothetical protein WCD35_12170, partial [Mycobacteriales bacterium]
MTARARRLVGGVVALVVIAGPGVAALGASASTSWVAPAGLDPSLRTPGGGRTVHVVVSGRPG